MCLLGEHEHWVYICIELVGHVINYTNVSGISPKLFSCDFMCVHSLSCCEFPVVQPSLCLLLSMYSLLKPKRTGLTLLVKMTWSGQWEGSAVKMPACKPADLGSIPQSHEVARKSWFLKVALWPPHISLGTFVPAGTCMPASTCSCSITHTLLDTQLENKNQLVSLQWCAPIILALGGGRRMRNWKSV